MTELKSKAVYEKFLRETGAPPGGRTWEIFNDVWNAALSSGTDAERDVLAERQRQKSVEGWTQDHDDEHDMGEMAHAAAWYSIDQMMRNALDERGLSFWPWAQEWWKPTTPRRDLVKAAALILAEIERIDRRDEPVTKDKK